MWQWYPAGRVLGMAVAAVRPWFRHGSGCAGWSRAALLQLYMGFNRA